MSRRTIQGSEIEAARKLQAVLIRIGNGERFFFNITTLQSKGLIYGIDHYYQPPSGPRERLKTTWQWREYMQSDLPRYTGQTRVSLP